MPKIISIRVSPRFSNRANIVFSDKSFLPIDIDSLYHLSLKKYQNISSKKLHKIAQASARYLLKNYALRQIAISAKTEKILLQKLIFFAKKIQNKFPLLSELTIPPLVQITLSYIKSKDLLRPEQFVDRVLRTHGHKSFSYIKARLRQSGIDPQYFPQSISAQEIDKIKTILNKKNLKNKDFSDYNVKNKVISSLARKGFSYPDIKSAFDDIKKFS